MPDQREHPFGPFGATLRRYRVGACLTQEELAERAGLSANAVSALERGINRAPQQGTLDLLIAALGLPADDATLLRASARRQPAVPSPSRTTGMAGDPQGGLPRPLTSFIGREAELATVRSLLSGPDAIRLLTITGPPGAGKTRLALEAAQSRRADDAGEVRFVPLASIADPALVLPAVAQALGLLQAPGRTVDAVLATALRQRHLLLVLDNFEQVTAAAPAIGALLGSCPRLHLLVTSRVRLGLYGEREFALGSLRLPPEEYTTGDSASVADVLARLAATEAVRLFVARAQAARSDFTLGADNAADVAGICRRLDGLPLAIELAAPRAKLLSPHALLARLDHRLALLIGGARDLPERQRTLRAAIAWSYDLLLPVEQALFRGLGVFVGGCTLEAAEAVFPADAEHGNTLDRLAALVDHSLVRQQEGRDGQPRFWMLETLLEFARERLTAHGEEEARDRHAAYYLALAEAAERGGQGAELIPWLDRTEAELENFRAAAVRLLEQGEHDRALRLVGALWFSFVARGRIMEGQGLLLPVVEATAGQRQPSRAKALFGAGFFLITFDDHAAGRPLLAESLAVAEEVGDAALTGYALLGLGLSYKSDEDWRRVRQCYERAIACFERSDDWWGLGWAYNYAAAPSFDPRDAPWQPALLERALGIFLSHGNAHGAAETYRILGVYAAATDDFAAARELLERSLAMCRTLGARLNVAWALEWLGGVTIVLGDLDAARRYLREALLLHRDLGNPIGMAKNLGGSAALACREGRLGRAAQLAGAVAAHDTPLGAPRRRAMPSQALRPESWQPQAQAALGRAAWEAAFAVGRQMPLDEAIAFAVADIWPASDAIFSRVSATRK